MRANTKFITKTASLLTITAGCLVLTGWFFDIPSFKSVLPGIISMKFNTALCFILSGIALYLLDVPAISHRRKTIAFICAWIILLAGLLNLSEYIFSRNLGIDELVWKEGPGTAGTKFPGRMSLITSINFTLLGFIFLTLNKRKYHWYIQALLIVMIPGSLMVIFNHLFGYSFLNTIPQLTSTALHTAILFVVLCVGIFFSSPLLYIRVPFKKKMVAAFVIVSLILGMIYFAFRGNRDRSVETDKLLKNANQLIYLTEEVDVNVYQMQSAIRGYIITGQEYYLSLFINASGTVDSIIRQLRIVTKGNTIHQQRIDTLEKFIGSYIDSRKELITIRRDEGFEAAQKIILNNSGNLLFNKMSSAHKTIEQDEIQLLAKRQAEDKQNIQNTSRIITFLGVIIVLLLLSALATINNNIRQRDKAEETLQKSIRETSDYKYALDESTIVAITDQNGIIRQVNDNFCKISKYKREELIGQDHRIINSGFHPEELFLGMWETISNGKLWRGEVKNKAKDGTYFWLDSTIVPFLDEQGKPFQYVAIRSDISKQKIQEENIKLFNEQLQTRVEEKTRELSEKEFFLRESQRAGNIGSYKTDFVTGYWQSSETLDGIFDIDKNYDRSISGWMEIVHPDDRQMMDEYLRLEVIGKRKSFNKEYRIIRNNDKQTRWVQGYGDIKIDDQGNIAELIGTIQDITQRKKAEEAILKERNLSDSIINSMPGMFYLFDETGKFLRWNKNFETVSGYSAAEISNTHPVDFFDADVKQLLENKIAEGFTKGMADVEAPFLTKTKEKIPYYFTGWQITYESKICLIGVGIDITEREKARKSLFDSQQRYKNLLDNMNDGFIVDDISGKIIFANKIFLEIYGFTEEDINNLVIEDYVAPDYREMLRDRHNRRLAGEKVSDNFEYEGIRKDGKRIWLEVRVNPIIENGIIIGTQSIIRDITESKRAEIALSESEETFRRLFNESADPILIIDDTGFTDCNHAAVSILGFSSRQEILNKKPWDISPERQPDGRLSSEKAEAMIAKAVREGYHQFEWEHLKSDGNKFPVEVMLTPIIFKGKQLVYVVWRDISERKKAEENIRKSNERYEFVNKATQDTIWEWDFVANEGHWGEGIIKTFGYSEADIKYGENWRDKYVHPSDKEQVSKKLHVCIESGIESWQQEYRFHCADGSYKNVYDRGFILYDEQGKPYRMIGSMTDVTEKKELERELVEMIVKKQKLITETTIQAQEKERNELGRELHDNINQILATVKMYLGMAKAKENMDKNLVGQSYEYVNEAMNEIRKLSHSLVAPSLGDIGLDEALQELADEINMTDKIHVQLVDEENNGQNLDKRMALMLYRIVQEQMNNIIKYSRAKKAVISLKKEGDTLNLIISDNGVGFDTTQISKGIGLKNIQNRVEFYSGKMNIISAPGQGCTLKIDLPLNNKIVAL